MTRTTTKRGSSDQNILIFDPRTAPPPVSRATFWHDDVTSLTLSRWACLAGWKRALIRWIVAPTLLLALITGWITDPDRTQNALGGIGCCLAWAAGRDAWDRGRHWRFRALYLRPLAHALAPVLGENPWAADWWIHVSRDMAGLAGRLARPMSPNEKAVRRAYGTYVQPVIRWVPEHLMRGYWTVHTWCEPFRNWVNQFRTPHATQAPRVEITVRGGFATRAQRELIRDVIPAKLGLGDLVESWDQVGPCPVVCYVVRERPPEAATVDHLRTVLPRLSEPEFFVGLTTGNRPVIISLDDDAPHLACSAGSGAGKSVLAKLIAVQVLLKDGRVVILDRKGSHRWARNLPGVTYCTKPADMHATLVDLAALADARNDQALAEEEGWDPGQRVFIIFEEMNATVAQLKQYWEEIRGKGDPKTSPAIIAFRNIMFMGRSAKMNLFGIAQMLTAMVTGGPEARENFGIRALARYTANNWKMLCPETPMPRKSKARGRWQFVIAGEAIETQVAFLTDTDVTELLADVPVSPSPQTPATQGEPAGTPTDGDTLTLREAHERFCPDVNFDTLKKRRSRARSRGKGPKFAAMRGRDETYSPDEIRQWLETESLISTESSDD